MARIKTPIGYIYALYYKNKPFYIGQTKYSIKERFRKHKYSCFNENKDKYVYSFIRRITDNDNFYNDITIKPLKIIKLTDLNFTEIKYIKYCIDKKIKLFNNCCKTNTYVVTKYGLTIQEYNSKIKIIKLQ